MSRVTTRRTIAAWRVNSLHQEPYRTPKVVRMHKSRTPRPSSMQLFKVRRHQTYFSTLRQRGRSVLFVLPPAWKLPQWRVGQRVWLQMREQVMVITRWPRGELDQHRYSTRIRLSHVSLVHARAEQLAKRMAERGE